jgi:hypothetical protein
MLQKSFETAILKKFCEYINRFAKFNLYKNVFKIFDNT